MTLTPVDPLPSREVRVRAPGKVNLSLRVGTATRRFARRQDSWFRKDPRVFWIRYDDPDLADEALSKIGQAQEAAARSD